MELSKDLQARQEVRDLVEAAAQAQNALRELDQAAIDRHHDTPMMGTIAALREKYDLHMKVERFVSDDEGVPQKDQAYIKE